VATKTGEAAHAKGLLLASQRQQNHWKSHYEKAHIVWMDADKKRQMPILRRAVQTACRVSQGGVLGLIERGKP